MGRYVLLEFDDSDAAATFIGRLEEATKEYDDVEQTPDVTMMLNGIGAIAAAHATVLAEFAKATKICDCARPSENSVRGIKLGWWVCPKCKKPKRRGAQSLRNILNPKLANTTRTGSPSLIVRWDVKDGNVITLIES